MLARDLPYRAIGSAHLLVQFLVDTFFIPSELLDVLRPLEIAHGDAAGVGENIRNDQDAAFVENLIGLRRRRSIGALDDDAGFDVAGVVFVDRVLQGGVVRGHPHPR